MLHFTLLAAVVVFASGAPHTTDIFKNDLSPKQAQRYLRHVPFNEPQLSGLIDVLPLDHYDNSRFRSADAGPTPRHYWKNGQEIQNTDDYVDEVYNAAQYQGQDGLGQYAYGYETPESSKVESRDASGTVSGSYVYEVPGQKELVRVNYYADSQGFHREDNVELTPEQARKSAAEAKSKPLIVRVKPPFNKEQYGNYEAQASEPEDVVVTYEVQASEPEGVYHLRDDKALAFAQAISYQENQQQQTGQQQQYAQQKDDEQSQQQQGLPHGFFYSFNYPVSVIAPKRALASRANKRYNYV